MLSGRSRTGGHLCRRESRSEVGPNGAGLPTWPAFTTTTTALQLTTAGNGVGTGTDVDAEHNCSAFWEPLFASTGLLQ